MLRRGRPFFHNSGAGTKEEKRRSVICPGMTLKGDIQGEESLQVGGWVEGSISLKGDAIIEAGAEVRADISATRIIVGGNVKGNLTALEKVEVLPTAKVRGAIQTKVLLVHEGAFLTGEVRTEAVPESRIEELEEEVNREKARTFWNQEE